MSKQEVKITNCIDDSSTFFFAHNLKTAMWHANEYMERNKGKFPMRIYTLNTSSFGAKWRTSGGG